MIYLAMTIYFFEVHPYEYFRKSMNKAQHSNYSVLGNSLINDI